MRRRSTGRRWGLHLVRRNGVFHFRRRWPAALRKRGAPEFLCISLRTHVLAEAVKRSADLLAAIEAGERNVLMELADSPTAEWRTRAMIREMVRAAVAAMLARQEAPVDALDTAAHLERLAQQSDAIRSAQKERDWSEAARLAGSAAALTGVPHEALVGPVLGREILSTARRLLELAHRVEEECGDPLHLGQELLTQVGLPARRQALRPPMLLSEAIEKAAEEAPDEVEKKVRAVGRLAIAFFGDVPVATLGFERVFEFLEFIWKMPKGWGKGHGRNRHGQPGREIDPLAEQREADAHDAAVLAEVMATPDLTLPEKRRRVVERLTPRLTDGYLLVQRDMFARIARAALGSAVVGRSVDDEDRVVPSHRQIEAKLVVWHKRARTPCGLPTRISRPKRRRSWSLEHVVSLLLSPIFAGSSSTAQRWRKATSSKRFILRDAFYWVPLFMITLGVRPEEILQLKVRNVRLRDGILCVFLGDDLDDAIKTEQSRRVLPVPELLLRLGFREWIAFKGQSGEVWAFPEVQPDASHDRRSQIWGDRMRTLLARLDLKCEREDIYAMRRTLASKLLNLGVDNGVRQRVLGHLEGTTVDRHYSDDGLVELKALLDQVDYGVAVGQKSGFAFPVITGCTVALLPPLEVLVALTDQGAVSALRLCDPDTDETVFAARIAGAPAPKSQEWDSLEVLTGRAVATRANEILAAYSAILPANEEAVAAFEHLLILGDPAPRMPLPPAPVRESAVPGRATDPHPVAPEPEAFREGPVLGLRKGDTAICVFPCRGRGAEDKLPRPGLVVAVRTLRGETFLDLAPGIPHNQMPVAPHELLVVEADETSSAGLAKPTRFDLRHRILVRVDDGSRLHRRLGSLSRKSDQRLMQSIQFAGDVSPLPVGEGAGIGRTPVVERRAKKVVHPPAPSPAIGRR